MSGLNFNSTDNKPNTIKNLSYNSLDLIDSTSYNNFNLSGATNFSITNGNGAKFTGIMPEYDGQILTLTNSIQVARTFTLQHLGNGSEDSYKIDLTAYSGGTDMVIDYLNTVVLKYNNVIRRWVLVSYSLITPS
jgi:hypothetical protein